MMQGILKRNVITDSLAPGGMANKQEEY
jgi:hypothetical protein